MSSQPGPSSGAAPPAADNLAAQMEALIHALTTAMQWPPPAPKFKDPHTFDGNRSRYGPWKHILQHVEDYKEALSTAHYNGDEWDYDTLDAFWTEMDGRFKDSNEASRAQSKLPHLKMHGGMTAQDFFTQWEQLCTKAGYTNRDDPFLLHLLQQAIHPDIVERLYVSGNAPGTGTGAHTIPNQYENWKTRWEEEESHQEFFDEVSNFVCEDPELFLSLVNPDSTPVESQFFPDDST
ncbi:hypothetical protein C8Q78DRAFT_1081027 [Trametes maxima]|nr:hypothetical protein C8Q78DRAFT_1081027 [Trametes maxima]